MTYNVWHGFHTFDQEFQPRRLDAARRVVDKEQPDLLALTEAWHHDVVDYQKAFDFPYAQRAPFPQEDNKPIKSNMLFARFPLEVEVITLSPRRAALRAHGSLDGRTLGIDVVHPQVQHTEEGKRQELQPLFPYPYNHYLITGDFNALSPEDQGYERGSMIQEVSQEGVHLPHPEQFIDELLKREFIAWILKQGLRDAFEKKEKRVSTVPTQVKYGRKVDGMRVDYFFISPNIAVEDAYVVKTEDAEQASDHYPIVGIFQFE